MNNMFIESESLFDFDDTAERLMKAIALKSWNLASVYDLQQTLEKHGKEVLPIKIFALCHPAHSGKILEKDDERIITPMMPCRVSIYMKSNGKTYISRFNPSGIASSFDGLIGEVMSDSSNEVEEILSNIVRKSYI